MLDTPVLFIIFNRPDYAKKVFAQIRKAKPKQLFIAADGPRKDNILDVEQCLKTRKIIEKIDWDCEVKTLLRDENLGCAKGVSGAITWFFEHVEEGIILEDDCVPDISFFTFCEFMLNKYRNTEGVMHVAGSNFHFKTFLNQNQSYYLSAFNPVWGWATWRTSWNVFSLTMNEGVDLKIVLSNRIKMPEFISWFLEMYNKCLNLEIDSWATPWTYQFHIKDGKCVTPCVNLVKNIGQNGIHYSGFRSPILNMPTYFYDINNTTKLIQTEIDYEKDNLTYFNILHKKLDYFDRILNKLYFLYYKLNHF
jgi:hypothetical protein